MGFGGSEILGGCGVVVGLPVTGVCSFGVGGDKGVGFGGR